MSIQTNADENADHVAYPFKICLRKNGTDNNVGANRLAHNLYGNVKAVVSVVGGLFVPNLWTDYNHDENKGPIKYQYCIIILKNQGAFDSYVELCDILIASLQTVLILKESGKDLEEDFLYKHLRDKLEKFSLKPMGLKERFELKKHQAKLIDRVFDEKQKYSVSFENTGKINIDNKLNEKQIPINFVAGVDDEDNTISTVETEPGSVNITPIEPDGMEEEGRGSTVQGPSIVESPQKRFGITTWAIVDRICLDNTRPSDLIEGGRTRKYYFSAKTRKIILKGIFSYVKVRKKFSTVQGTHKDYPTLALVDEDKFEV